MTRPTPRRPATSRGGTSRPRKLAGQTGGPGGPGEPAGSREASDRLAHGHDRAGEVPEPPPLHPPEGERGPGVLARVRTTRVLTVLLGLLALVLAVQAAWWLTRDDEAPAATSSDDGALSVPADRPVVANSLQVLDGVDAAAKAAQEIVATDFQQYADEVDAAAALMTADFAEEYRRTAADIEPEFVANETVVQASVVAQGVVRSSRTRLEALVFLNQVVARTVEGEKETFVTPYKVLVTMVHTDEGWFVEGLDTDETGDKSN